MSRPRLIALLLALVTCAIYLPVGHYGFSAFDDNDCVSKNEVVQSGLTWSGVRWAFTTGRTGNWMPLTWISHMAVCQLFGLKPGAHHLVNVLFHAANAVLLLVLLLRLTNALWPSAFAAALFAWHPLHVESVAWIAERKDVLSTFFGLAALLAYTRYAQGRARVEGRESSAGSGSLALDPLARRLVSAKQCEDGSEAKTARRWTLGYFLALLFFALSLMSKPMLVTLPFVMLLLDYWPLQRIPTTKGDRGPALLRLALEKWPFFVLSAALCAITFLAQRAAGLVNSLEAIPVSDRLENVPLAYSRYLLQMIWPAHLAVFYPVPWEISPLALAAAALVLVLISAAVWLGRKRSPYWLAGWLWFLGTLVPVNGLLTFGGQAMANRFTYFPSIGIFLAVALGFRAGASRFRLSTRVVAVVAGAVLAACLALTENQLRYWRDDVSLFSHVIDVTKDTRWVHFRDLGILHYQLGFALENEGRKADAIVQYRTALMLRPYYVQPNNNLGIALAAEGKWDEAIRHYERALQIKPDNAEVHCNLGGALAAEGKWDEAIRHYERALQIKPDNAEVHCNLGIALTAQGKLTEAMQHFERALQLKPDYAEGHFNLGIALTAQGKLTEAMQQYERALQLKPDYAEAHNNLGIALARQGRLTEAIQHFERALQIKPDDAEAHDNLGIALASQGKLAEAMQHFEQALQIKPDYAKAHNNLGIALASQGKSAEAMQQFQQALTLATAQGNTTLAETIRTRLKSYPPPLPPPQTP
jgi:tetratricopeptide (TPR) repeat protein